VELRDRKADLLLFLVEGKRRAAVVDDDPAYAKVTFAPRYSHSATESILELGKHHAYDSAFRALATGDEVVAAARAAAGSQATRSFRVDVPFGAAAYRELAGGSAVWMYLPIDAALERRAVDWIVAADVATRKQGAEAIALFHNDANVARLENLLTDPGFVVTSINGGPRKRRFVVRETAHNALAAWNVQHATPKLEEPD
jgi:hypothetical protein